MEKINAIILAGDSRKGSVDLRVDNKAFITIEGKWMVEYVVDALEESSCIDKISIVGPVQDLKGKFNDRITYYFDDRGSLFENVNVGLEPFENDKRVILITSDIPLITGCIINDFIKRCRKEEADLCYPIVEKHINEYKYPGFERTYVKLKEGTFTGGNIICINPQVIKPCEEFARKAIKYRKNPWKTSRLLGLKFLVMLLMGVLSIPRVEERFSELLKINAVAVITPYPELANDVDKPSDLEMINRYMKKRQQYLVSGGDSHI